MKLHIILAKTDHMAAQFKAAVADYLAFFKGKHAHFRGEKKTYTAKEGTVDDPSKRGVTNVITTVEEKLDWLEEHHAQYIDALFQVEATNASGTAKANLKVGDDDFGEMSSLELLRLKSLLESNKFRDMYAEIPVRSDSEIWAPSKNEAYTNREVFETELIRGTAKTTVVEHYILEDPNVAKLKDATGYKPTTATNNTVVELGEYTTQKFSGEWSPRQRAKLLARHDQLLTAVIGALKECNEAEVVESNMTAEKLFEYLHSDND